MILQVECGLQQFRQREELKTQGGQFGSSAQREATVIMAKRQDGIAILINLRNDGQLPWLIERLESIFGKEYVDSLYTEKAITITIGKRDFTENNRREILEVVRKFDGVVLDEVEIYDHF